jgi:hypothetical protein
VSHERERKTIPYVRFVRSPLPEESHECGHLNSLMSETGAVSVICIAIAKFDNVEIAISIELVWQDCLHRVTNVFEDAPIPPTE